MAFYEGALSPAVDYKLTDIHTYAFLAFRQSLKGQSDTGFSGGTVPTDLGFMKLISLITTEELN